MTRAARGSGFTLVEVLIATAVLAIGLLGALTAFSMASRAIGASVHDTAVALLAQQKLADITILASAQDLRTGETGGNFGEAYPGYSWRLVVHPPDGLQVQQADLTIYAPQAGKKRETRFSTAVF